MGYQRLPRSDDNSTSPKVGKPSRIRKKKISATKSTVVDLISNNQQVTDDHVASAYYVLLEAVKGNGSFMDEYFNLLKQHKIIQNGSDNTDYSDI